MENTTATETATIHPFQAAGLGLAPFRFVGMDQQDLCYGEAILNRAEYQETGIRMTTKPGGSCAYCGTYILNMYGIKSADGNRFHVGSECVKKTGDAKLIKAVTKVANTARATARKAKEEKTVAYAMEMIKRPGIVAALSAKSHPHGFRAARGETLLNYVQFLFLHAGQSGKLRAVSIVAQFAGEV